MKAMSWHQVAVHVVVQDQEATSLTSLLVILNMPSLLLMWQFLSSLLDIRLLRLGMSGIKDSSYHLTGRQEALPYLTILKLLPSPEASQPSEIW